MSLIPKLVKNPGEGNGQVLQEAEHHPLQLVPHARRKMAKEQPPNHQQNHHNRRGNPTSQSRITAGGQKLWNPREVVMAVDHRRLLGCRRLRGRDADKVDTPLLKTVA